MSTDRGMEESLQKAEIFLNLQAKICVLCSAHTLVFVGMFNTSSNTAGGFGGGGQLFQPFSLGGASGGGNQAVNPTQSQQPVSGILGGGGFSFGGATQGGIFGQSSLMGSGTHQPPANQGGLFGSMGNASTPSGGLTGMAGGGFNPLQGGGGGGMTGSAFSFGASTHQQGGNPQGQGFFAGNASAGGGGGGLFGGLGGQQGLGGANASQPSLFGNPTSGGNQGSLFGGMGGGMSSNPPGGASSTPTPLGGSLFGGGLQQQSSTPNTGLMLGNASQGGIFGSSPNPHPPQGFGGVSSSSTVQNLGDAFKKTAATPQLGGLFSAPNTAQSSGASTGFSFSSGGGITTPQNLAASASSSLLGGAPSSLFGGESLASTAPKRSFFGGGPASSATGALGWGSTLSGGGLSGAFQSGFQASSLSSPSSSSGGMSSLLLQNMGTQASGAGLTSLLPPSGGTLGGGLTPGSFQSQFSTGVGSLNPGGLFNKSFSSPGGSSLLSSTLQMPSTTSPIQLPFLGGSAPIGSAPILSSGGGTASNASQLLASYLPANPTVNQVSKILPQWKDEFVEIEKALTAKEGDLARLSEDFRGLQNLNVNIQRAYDTEHSTVQSVSSLIPHLDHAISLLYPKISWAKQITIQILRFHEQVMQNCACVSSFLMGEQDQLGGGGLGGLNAGYGYYGGLKGGGGASQVNPLRIPTALTPRFYSDLLTKVRESKNLLFELKENVDCLRRVGGGAELGVLEEIVELQHKAILHHLQQIVRLQKALAKVKEMLERNGTPIPTLDEFNYLNLPIALAGCDVAASALPSDSFTMQPLNQALSAGNFMSSQGLSTSSALPAFSGRSTFLSNTQPSSLLSSLTGGQQRQLSWLGGGAAGSSNSLLSSAIGAGASNTLAPQSGLGGASGFSFANPIQWKK